MPNLVSINLTVEIPDANNRARGGVINLYTGDFIGHGQTGTVKYDNETLTLLVDLVASYGYTIREWEFITETFSVRGDTEPVLGATTLAENANATLKLILGSISPPAAGTPAPPTQYNMSVMSNYSIVPSFNEQVSSGDYTISYAVVANTLRRRGTFAISYTVSVPYIPANLLQFHNVKSGEEVWQLVKADIRNQHFIDYRLRYFTAREGYLWFLLVSHSDLQPTDVKVRLLRYDYVNDVWEVRGEASFGTLLDILPTGGNPPQYPSFGCVAEGHNGIVYANAVGAVYFPYDDNLEPILIPLFSSAFTPSQADWSQFAVLTVPEGFLFLPHGILWDFDVFYDIPVDLSLSPGDRLVPVYLENTAGVIVRTKEYPYSPSATIKAFYVWGGLDKGLIKGKVGVGSNLSGEQANPIFLGGVKVQDVWYAFNAYPHWDEATVLGYTIQKSAQNPADRKNWQWTLVHKHFALPLPFSAPIINVPHLPPGWGEIWYFSLGGNNHYVYFTRMFDRVYRIRHSNKQLSLAHAFPYLDFAGNIIPRFSGIEPAIAMFSLNLSDGRVYACHLRSGGRIQIWRQSTAVTPPEPPTILFPPTGEPVPRQFDIIFKPAIDSRPQEFSVFIVVETSWGKQNYNYYSFLQREFFQVSTDGGQIYTPMSGPIIVDNDNIRVKFAIPHRLPPASIVTVIVTAYAIE